MDFKKFALISVSLLSLAACSGVRTYTAPANPEGAEQERLSDISKDRYATAEPTAAWWMEFDDPQLAALVSQAINRNHDIRIAVANLNAARANLRETKFDRIPKVTADASYERQRLSEETGSSRLADRTVNSYEAGFDASWELDLFGRVSESVAEQEALSDAAQAELDQVYVSVAAEVARAYIDLRGAQYRLDIAERNASNQEETYTLTKKLAEGGRSTALDVSRSETQLNLTKARIPPLQAEATSAIYRLSVLTGYVPSTLRSTLENRKQMPSLPVSISVGDAASLLKRRPDIRMAERELAASVAKYNVTASDLFPAVNIIGSLGFLATNLSSFGGSALAASVGPSITWSAFDLGRVKARIDQADAQSQASLAKYEKTVLVSLQEAQTTLSNFVREEERRATLQKAAQSSRKAADIARQRYELGVDAFLDVLDSERTLLDAEDALAVSEIQAATDLIAIYKALGGGWNVVAEEGFEPPTKGL